MNDRNRCMLVVSLVAGTSLVAEIARAAATAAEYWDEPRGDYEGRQKAFLEHAAGAQPSPLHA